MRRSRKDRLQVKESRNYGQGTATAANRTFKPVKGGYVGPKSSERNLKETLDQRHNGG